MLLFHENKKVLATTIIHQSTLLSIKHPMNANKKSRRSFLKKALALSAASAVAPSVWNNASANIFEKTSFRKAGEKVNLACIGIGNQGGSDVFSMFNTGLCNLVAFCDVDMGAPQTLEVLKKFPDVPRFQDFRKMFEKMGNQIEAVTIGVPDHSHFPITMMALGLGKHVYVEKPMARTFHEVELMMMAARKHSKQVTQMGNQGHSDGNYFFHCRAVFYLLRAMDSARR